MADDLLSVVDPGLSIAASVFTLVSGLASHIKSNTSQKHRRISHSQIEASLGSYVSSEYGRFSQITSFAFEGKRPLLDMYIPSTLVYPDNRRITVQSLDDYMSLEQKLLVKDSAGMGKSTLSKYLFVVSVESAMLFPILAEARKYDGNIDFEEYLFSLLMPNYVYDADVFNSVISHSETLIIIDGMDEIPLAHKKLAFSKISKFVDETDSRIVVTSRPEDMLSALQNPYSVYLSPLPDEKAFDLIRRIDIKGDRAELLIEKISSNKNRDIQQFLKNPMMVSLLYRSFAYRQDIPVKKPVFYRQVYDALYTTHDLAKGDAYVRDKYSGLDIESFHKATRALAYLTYRDSRLEFYKDEILRYIRDSKGLIGDFTYDEANYLMDLYNTVPLFIKEGETFRWSHKSIQEYFASQFISNDAGDNAKDILLSIFNSKNILYYQNLLEMLYDTNYKMFEQHFLVFYLEGIKLYVETLKEEYKDSRITEEEIERRGGLRFFADFTIFPFDIDAVSIEEEDDKVSVNKRLPDYISSIFDRSGELLGTDKSIFISHTANKMNVVVHEKPEFWLASMLQRKNSPLIKKVDGSKVVYEEPIMKKQHILVEDPRRIFNKGINYSRTTELISIVLGFEVDYSKVRDIIESVEDSKNGKVAHLLMS